MASRLDFSQIRSLYVGTSSSTQVGTDNLVVAGNVGIGTTAPGAKLQINDGTGSAEFLRLSVAYDTSRSARGGIYWHDTSNTTGRIYTEYDGTMTSMVFGSLYNSGYNSNNLMIIRGNGNVGIGTTAPLAKLHVIGSIDTRTNNSVTDTSIVLFNVYNGPPAGDGTTIGTGITWKPLYDGYSKRSAGIMQIAEGNYFRAGLAFYTNGVQNESTDWSERLRISSTGNVGIGTTAPDAKLVVTGDGSGTAKIGPAGFGGNYTGISLNGTLNTVSYNFLSSTTDTHLYINRPTGNDIYFRLANNDQAVIKASGNVGIGTTAPDAKLHVDGTVATNSALADVGAYRILKPNGGISSNSGWQSGAIKITYPVGYTYSMHRVKVNVYEYTTNESFTIYFGGYNYAASSEWYNEFAYILSNSGTDRNFTVRFGYDGSKMVVYIGELSSSWAYPQIFIEEVELGYSGHSATWRDGAWGIGFETSAFQNVTRTVVNTQATNWGRTGNASYYNFGNVGIGTTAPEKLLHISGGSGNVDNLILESAYVTSGVGVAMQFNRGTGVLARIRGIEEGAWNGGLLFEVRSGNTYPGYNGATDVAMKIATNGNVGIGTTAPGYKFTVAGSGHSWNVSPHGSGIDLYSTGNIAPHYQTTFDWYTGAPGAGTFRMGLTSAGRLGIGTTSPSYSLDVSGTIRATGDVIAYSDARVKENVETLDGALDKVMKMRGVSYNKIGEQEKKVGVIAQEILEVLPEVVSQDETGTYSVAYGNIVSVLIEAIKEQQKQIDELKAKLK